MGRQRVTMANCDKKKVRRIYLQIEEFLKDKGLLERN